MIENLKRSREPLAWIAIALTAASMGLGVWRLVTTIGSGDVPVFAAFQDVSNGLLNISVALLVVVLVMSCSFVTPATKHAIGITRAAAWVLSLGVLLTLASNLMGMWASAALPGVVLDILGGLLDLAFKALAAGLLWVFLRGVKAGRIGTAPRETPTDGPVGDAADAVAGAPTSWSRDEATGTVWRTAADAAKGAPGLDRMPDSEESTQNG
jgi:hypothetical protein